MIKSFIALVVFLILAVAPFAAQAANPCTVEGLRANANQISTLPMCINQIYVWSLGLGALLALLMTVIGGYKYMTAGGNAEATAQGQEYIWGSVIGLALLFTAYLLLRTINPDLTNFNNDSFNKLQAPASTAPAGPRQP